MATAWSLQDPHVKRLAGKEEITTLAEVMDPDHQDVIAYPTLWGQGRISLALM